MFGGSRSMPLFRVSGIQVGVDWTWLLMLGYVVVVLSGDFQSLLGDGRQVEAFGYAVFAAFLFFGSIILHELGHAVVARRNGIGILGIDLWILGGLAKMDREPQSPGVEFRVASAGPLATAMISAVCLGLAFGVDSGQAGHLVQLETQTGDTPWIVAVAWAGAINVFLLAFNLIPAYPLDGGRMARAVIWRFTRDRQRATVVTANIGRVFGYGLIALGLFTMRNSIGGGVLLVFLGFTMAQAARGATIQNELLGEATHLTVADVMDRQPVAMPGDATVQRALDEYFWRYHWPWFPVVDHAGHFLGLIEQHAVELVDEGDRWARKAAELVAPGSSNRRSVAEDTPLTAVLANPDLRDYGALMAVDGDGLLSGVVTAEQVQRGLHEAINRAVEAHQPPSDL